ncbi:cystatin-SA-like [Panonychus citri]|uniref:cystatin-SA-like n=1 Tax=Panonychus citri TaxID=50023 RepID=UPI002307AF40|nr:cystatin-SA-like [Panonychus citri]
MKFVIILTLVGLTMAKLGEWNAMANDGHKAIELAKKGVAHYNLNSKSFYYRKLVDIKSAKSKTDNGATYEIIFEIDMSNCLKTKPYSEECKVQTELLTEECTYVFYSAPKSDECEIVKGSCIPLN